MITRGGEPDPEPKSTPEEKKVSEVEEEITGTPKKEVQESKDQKVKKESTPKEEKPADDNLSKMESELGRLRQELGEERKKAEELSAYKLAYERNQQQQQPQPQAPNYDEEFFDKPTQTIQKILAQYDAYRTREDAFSSAETALAQAKVMYPERFEGVDEQMVRQVMMAPVQQGQVRPSVLKDPNVWAGAAWVARGYQTGYKMPEPAPQQMNPYETERPGQPPRSRDEDVPTLRNMDDLTKTLVNELMRTGLSKEEAIAEVQATRESGL
jgi:hypothetical protein